MPVFSCSQRFLFLLLAVLPLLGFADDVMAKDPQTLVIAHRGASGYLPEHSLPAKAMAHAMGADYIEQDLVMTRDNRLVVLHDHFLDRISDVAEIFPGRQREDGRYYAIDFSLAEIKQLAMTESFELEQGKAKQTFPERFPINKSSFSVNTFEEEIELIQGLNKSTGKRVGIYPEIKSPWFHLKEGKDISKAALTVLKSYGYKSKKDLVYLQCFDPIENKRIHDVLFEEIGVELKLIQLIADTAWNETMIINEKGTFPFDYSSMISQGAALKEVASYADGIGPWIHMVIDPKSQADDIRSTGLVERAHSLGLDVHPYTFRADKEQIPDYAESFEDLLRIFVQEENIDGLFSDFPDKVVAYLEKQNE